MADRLEEAGADTKADIVVSEGGGRARLPVDKLGAVSKPESLTWLKATTEAMLPRIDLPDLLFEVHSGLGTGELAYSGVAYTWPSPVGAHAE
ncbi:hypothetical protein [Streptomyces sp. NPDC056191]|uniref:hypothetical protein n=1 Tax=Streptomyces sp. NPDC056191 TaxID=3345742 RepID=UPI0035D7FDAC